jgi:hypothetical protein
MEVDAHAGLCSIVTIWVVMEVGAHAGLCSVKLISVTGVTPVVCCSSVCSGFMLYV